MSQADRIVDIARTAIGTPYRHTGRNKSGMDCLGLLLYIVARLNCAIPYVAPYSRVPSGWRFKSELDKYLTRIRITDLMPGDVLLLSYSKQPHHVGIVSGTNPIILIHADSEAGSVVETQLTRRRVEALRAAYRVPDVVAWLS